MAQMMILPTMALLVLFIPIGLAHTGSEEGVGGGHLVDAQSSNVKNPANFTIDSNADLVDHVGSTGEYELAHAEIRDWFFRIGGAPDSIKELPVVGVIGIPDYQLLIIINGNYADQSDMVKERFQQLYPDLFIHVMPVSPDWRVHESVSVCMSSDHGCSPYIDASDIVGTDDPIQAKTAKNTDEYIQAHTQVYDWFFRIGGAPDSIKELPVVGVSLAENRLVIIIDKNYEDQKEDVEEKFQQIYPKLDIVVIPVKSESWLDKENPRQISPTIREPNVKNNTNLIIESQSEQLGPVDEYTRAANEVTGWFFDGGDVHESVEHIPVMAVGHDPGRELFIGVDKSYSDLKETVKERFQQIYPGLNIVIGTIGQGEWTTGHSICASTIDNCTP